MVAIEFQNLSAPNSNCYLLIQKECVLADRRNGDKMKMRRMAPIKSGEHRFLSGGGELGQLIEALDWSQTSIGPISAWPGSLKTAVSLILGSNVPMVMLWGRDGVMIYNDAYAVFADQRHPKLLGSKVLEGWPEIADFNSHVMQVCLAGGTLAYRDLELTLHRTGASENVWMNLDYSPIRDERGDPVGVIAIVVETTARVLVEQRLASKRERQRQMFEQAPGFIALLTGPDHVCEIANAAYMQLVGHRAVVGEPIRVVRPQIGGQELLAILDHVFTTGEPFSGSRMQADMQRAQGGATERRLVDVVFQPVRDPHGKIIGIFMQGQDVTDRIKADQALERSERRFRTFAEAMPNHVWTASPDGLLDWVNSRIAEYSGVDPSSLLGKDWIRIVHSDDVAAAADKWLKAVSNSTLYETEFRLRRHDGAYRWYIVRAIPIRDADGTITQWIGTNTDIHDQKQAEQSLRESERRLQLSQRAAGIASLELDIETGNVIGSDPFYELWGLTKRDSVHISVLEDIVVPEDGQLRSTPETRQNGTAQPNVEYRIRRPDTGALRWLSRSIEFVHDAGGQPVKMFGVVQDVTDRKEAQSRQLLLTHELEHRIKNILAMVTAIASQTLRHTDIDTAREAFIDRLRALAQAHDILNTTRWTNASMHQVIENTIAAFPTSQITASGPALSINPKMALSLALAVNELATNALKYGALSTSEGTVTMEWSLSAAASDPPTLTWRWREQNGPAVVPPTHKGFGSLLIGRVFGADFGGTVRIQYSAAGVECVLMAPLPRL